MKKLKIYGERNTGTNYFIKLVANNLDIPLYNGNTPTLKIGSYTLPTGSNIFQNNYFGLTWSKNLGWKHSSVKAKKLARHKNIDHTYFCTLSKNPYSFLLSLYKRPYHYKGDRTVPFSEFITTPWEVQSRDNHGQRQYEHPIALWNLKNRSYIDLKNTFPKRTLNLTYENLLAHPEQILTEIGREFSIAPRQQFENLTASTKESSKSYDHYKDYYLNELWREKLSDTDIQYINAHLDKVVMNYFDYKMIETSEK